MNEKMYSLMDWSAMEALVYSESDNPHAWLGAHETENGVLYNTYQPTAKSATLYLKKSKKSVPMENADDLGNFSALIEAGEAEDYCIDVVYDNDSRERITDPYSFAPLIYPEDEDRFVRGVHYDIFNLLGAHPVTYEGVKGTYFAVWAPNALRVSVVGDFNLWDGRRHPMRRLPMSGIFELFIPGVSEGELYKFEIKAKNGLAFLKADPYANYAELRPNNASVVTSLSFKWNDGEWMKKRKKTDVRTSQMSVYEVHLGSWKRKGEGDNDFYNYRELAPELAKYIKDMGYTHIELMPIMEHPFDGSWGYQVTGYYAPTSRYGTPEDFAYFMNYMHEQGIGVILDWVPAHFPRDAFGLAGFDGTCLYEHEDPRKGAHPHWGTLIFNYGRPEVSNFLIANALFWIEKYHADGIRMDAVASMLYLDYGKNDGEWVANIYGGNENLEAIELLKHLNSIFHKRQDGAVIIAEESTAWPMVTGDVENGSLGFDLKWNMGWMNDFTGYMRLDPLFRKGRHGALTFGIHYAYSENFILVFSHDEVVHGKGSMINKMPGDEWQKAANLKAAYGFMAGHPGKKLLFMGQDFGQYREWSEARSLDWELLDTDLNRQIHDYYRELNLLAAKNPACYKLDFDPAGFRWMSCMDADHSIVSFIRCTEKKEETLLFVCNFTPVEYEEFRLAVPFAGKYKELLNSDSKKFGGHNMVNSRAKQSQEVAVDGQENSILIKLPPLSTVVFSVTPDEEKKKAAKKTTAGKTAETKPAAKKAAAKKPAEVKVEEEEKPAVKKAAEKKPAAKKAAAKKEAVDEPQEASKEKKVKKPAKRTKKSE